MPAPATPGLQPPTPDVKPPVAETPKEETKPLPFPFEKEKEADTKVSGIVSVLHKRDFFVCASSFYFVYNFNELKSLFFQSKIGASLSPPPNYTVADCRSLVRTLVSGVKTITWGTASCKAPSMGMYAVLCVILEKEKNIASYRMLTYLPLLHCRYVYHPEQAVLAQGNFGLCSAGETCSESSGYLHHQHDIVWTSFHQARSVCAKF